MATFNPLIPMDHATNLPLSGSRVPVFMQDLSGHVESFTEAEIVIAGQILCQPLTETEKDEVMTFYETNKNTTFTFNNPHDGDDYTLKFISPPPSPRYFSGSISHYTLTLAVSGEKL